MLAFSYVGVVVSTSITCGNVKDLYLSNHCCGTDPNTVVPSDCHSTVAANGVSITALENENTVLRRQLAFGGFTPPAVQESLTAFAYLADDYIDPYSEGEWTPPPHSVFCFAPWRSYGANACNDVWQRVLYPSHYLIKRWENEVQYPPTPVYYDETGGINPLEGTNFAFRHLGIRYSRYNVYLEVEVKDTTPMPCNGYPWTADGVQLAFSQFLSADDLSPPEEIQNTLINFCLDGDGRPSIMYERMPRGDFKIGVNVTTLSDGMQYHVRLPYKVFSDQPLTSGFKFRMSAMVWNDGRVFSQWGNLGYAKWNDGNKLPQYNNEVVLGDFHTQWADASTISSTENGIVNQDGTYPDTFGTALYTNTTGWGTTLPLNAPPAPPVTTPPSSPPSSPTPPSIPTSFAEAPSTFTFTSKTFDFSRPGECCGYIYDVTGFKYPVGTRVRIVFTVARPELINVDYGGYGGCVASDKDKKYEVSAIRGGTLDYAAKTCTIEYDSIPYEFYMRLAIIAEPFEIGNCGCSSVVLTILED